MNIKVNIEKNNKDFQILEDNQVITKVVFSTDKILL